MHFDNSHFFQTFPFWFTFATLFTDQTHGRVDFVTKFAFPWFHTGLNVCFGPRLHFTLLSFGLFVRGGRGGRGGGAGGADGAGVGAGVTFFFWAVVFGYCPGRFSRSSIVIVVGTGIGVEFLGPLWHGGGDGGRSYGLGVLGCVSVRLCLLKAESTTVAVCGVVPLPVIMLLANFFISLAPLFHILSCPGCVSKRFMFIFENEWAVLVGCAALGRK